MKRDEQPQNNPASWTLNSDLWWGAEEVDPGAAGGLVGLALVTVVAPDVPEGEGPVPCHHRLRLNVPHVEGTARGGHLTPPYRAPWRQSTLWFTYRLRCNNTSWLILGIVCVGIFLTHLWSWLKFARFITLCALFFKIGTIIIHYVKQTCILRNFCICKK